MTLTYKFQKEKLANGNTVSRPKIIVGLKFLDKSLDIMALVDSGCDITVIPQSIAETLGLPLEGKRSKMFGYREEVGVIESFLNITFIGRVERESITLNRVPVLIALRQEGESDESEITLGVQRIFDEFKISFRKSKNRIEFKRELNQKI